MANIPMHKIQTDKYGAFETAYRASNGKLYLPKTTGRIIVDGPFGLVHSAGTIQVIGGKGICIGELLLKAMEAADAVLSKLTKAGKNPEIERQNAEFQATNGDKDRLKELFVSKSSPKRSLLRIGRNPVAPPLTRRVFCCR